MVETMLAVFLTILVLALANAFFILGLNTFHQQKDWAEVGENLRIGINRLSRELRQATGVISYRELNRGILNFTNLDNDTVTYSVSKSTDNEAAYQLIRSIRGAGHNPVARYVHKLKVELTDAQPGTATITLTGAKGKSGDVTISTTIRLRN